MIDAYPTTRPSSFRRGPRSTYACILERNGHDSFGHRLLTDWLLIMLSVMCDSSSVASSPACITIVPHSRPRSATRRFSSDPFEITCLRTSTVRPRRGSHPTNPLFTTRALATKPVITTNYFRLWNVGIFARLFSQFSIRFTSNDNA